MVCELSYTICELDASSQMYHLVPQRHLWRCSLGSSHAEIWQVTALITVKKILYRKLVMLSFPHQIQTLCFSRSLKSVLCQTLLQYVLFLGWVLFLTFQKLIVCCNAERGLFFLLSYMNLCFLIISSIVDFQVFALDCIYII